MTPGNRLLKWLNTPSTRFLLEKLIFLQYSRKGRNIQRVKYHQEYDAWEFRIDGTTYLSSGPGWTYDGEYLSDLFKSLSGNKYLPSPGDTVIDIGAGVGEETIVLSSLVGTKGRVYAIEAHPRTFQALRYLVTSNNLTNVETSNVAISDSEGPVAIEDTSNSLANSIIQNTGGNQFSIPGETLDNYVSRHRITRIDLLKMNVEGAEQLIVKGMNTSWDLVRHTAISCHDFRFRQGESAFFKTKDIIIDVLKSRGFDVTTQHSNDSMIDDYVYGFNPKYRAM